MMIGFFFPSALFLRLCALHVKHAHLSFAQPGLHPSLYLYQKHLNSNSPHNVFTLLFSQSMYTVPILDLSFYMHFNLKGHWSTLRTFESHIMT